jgi:hypothetical protein
MHTATKLKFNEVFVKRDQPKPSDELKTEQSAAAIDRGLSKTKTNALHMNCNDADIATLIHSTRQSMLHSMKDAMAGTKIAPVQVINNSNRDQNLYNIVAPLTSKLAVAADFVNR